MVAAALLFVVVARVSGSDSNFDPGPATPTCWNGKPFTPTSPSARDNSLRRRRRAARELRRRQPRARVARVA